MHGIDANAIYTTEEVVHMLSGCVKLDTLRAHGLVSQPGAGNWGADLIFAINAMQAKRRTKKHGKTSATVPGDRLRDQPQLLIIEQAAAVKAEPELSEAEDPLVAEATSPSTPSPMK